MTIFYPIGHLRASYLSINVPNLFIQKFMIACLLYYDDHQL